MTKSCQASLLVENNHQVMSHMYQLAPFMPMQASSDLVLLTT